MSSKQVYLLIGLIVLLIVIAVILTVVSEEGFMGSESDRLNASAISVSDQAETINMENIETQPFQKVILDPFVVHQGTTQKVVVVPKDGVTQIEVGLTDGTGKQQKILKDTTTLEGKSAYYLKWEPQQIDSRQSYPITLKAATQSGNKHTFTVNWQTE